MRSILLTTVSAFVGLVAASSAFAADLPRKGPPSMFSAAPASSWTGFYVGGHIGAGQQTVDGTFDIPAIPAVGLPLVNGSGNGLLGGVQGGYNYQMGWAVIGIEGSFSWTGIDGQAPCASIVFANCTAKSDWIASVSGRFGGLVTDRFLAYGKVGAVWKDSEYTTNFPLFGGAVAPVTISDTRFGYLVGFGGEYKFTQNWSGFTEYNYMDFGKENYLVTFGGLGGAAVTSHVQDRVHVLKAGINYNF